MPPAFPETEFRELWELTHQLLPKWLSEQHLNDPARKREHFEQSWEAVRHRYLLCSSSNEDFRKLLAEPSEMWQAGWEDRALAYELERCIYVFFMSALSIFESFAYNLYFLGSIIDPDGFPQVCSPKNITLKITRKDFEERFEVAEITGELVLLAKSDEFARIDEIRNILAHRLSGRRTVSSQIRINPDGTDTESREEKWFLPGTSQQLLFDENLLQGFLNGITNRVKRLVSGALGFVASNCNVKN